MKKYLRGLFIRFAGSLKLRLEEILRDENERRMSEVLQEIEVRRKSIIRQQQQQCPHIAGCNPVSDRLEPGGRTSIVWHVNNLGIELGVCSVCQRVFLPTDEDYAAWKKKPSFHRRSSSGQHISVSEHMKEVCLENLMVISDQDALVPLPPANQAEVEECLLTTDDPWLAGDQFYQSIVDFGSRPIVRKEEETNEQS